MPCVAGNHITVQNALELLIEELSFEEIIKGYYLELEVEDIQACLHCAIALITSDDIQLFPASA